MGGTSFVIIWGDFMDTLLPMFYKKKNYDNNKALKFFLNVYLYDNAWFNVTTKVKVELSKSLSIHCEDIF